MGAFAAQVNPVVLRYTVDTIERLLREGRTASRGTSLLLLISAVLLGKEIINTGLRYGQNQFAGDQLLCHANYFTEQDKVLLGTLGCLLASLNSKCSPSFGVFIRRATSSNEVAIGIQ